MTEHQTTISSVQAYDARTERQITGYRARCVCNGLRSPLRPLDRAGHAMAANDGDMHREYELGTVARLTGKGQGA